MFGLPVDFFIGAASVKMLRIIETYSQPV